jgi:hypothetical protein
LFRFRFRYAAARGDIGPGTSLHIVLYHPLLQRQRKTPDENSRMIGGALRQDVGDGLALTIWPGSGGALELFVQTDLRMRCHAPCPFPGDVARDLIDVASAAFPVFVPYRPHATEITLPGRTLRPNLDAGVLLMLQLIVSKVKRQTSVVASEERVRHGSQQMKGFHAHGAKLLTSEGRLGAGSI